MERYRYDVLFVLSLLVIIPLVFIMIPVMGVVTLWAKRPLKSLK